MEQDKVKKIAENMEDDYIFKAIEEYSIDKDDIIDYGALKLELSRRDFKNRKNLDSKIYSPVSIIGGHEWRILFFPIGNECHTSISFFVEFKDIQKLQAKENVFVLLQFLIKSCYLEQTKRLMKTTSHIFDRLGKDWGFQKFSSADDLLNPENGYMTNDHPLTLIANVIVCKGTSEHWIDQLPYDSKKMTGFVGLKNQGATCYMNSILQTLFFTNQLRKAVFQMPTESDDENSVSLALQRVFYNLQEGTEAVSTSELTKSFGWTSSESFMQHDVQEFSRVLCDHLETKMKNTSVDGIIGKLFEGKMKSFIKCIHVDYQSERSESFYDIQLNVKGMKTLYDSFNDYVAIETLDGDNKYRAEGYGLQDAKKGVIFQSFPPVLHLQLKRFEYDLYADQMVKINDRYEFPDHINLDKYLEKKEPGSLGGYTLHAVLVHAGDLNGGHYVVFNKPKIGGDWLKIDDDRVTKVDAKEAIEGNYGSDAAVNTSEVGQLRDPQRLKLKHYSNAYMLVYIRDSCLKEVLCEVSINDVPLHLRARFEREEVEEQRKLRELEEAATLMDVTIITFDNLRNHTSIGIYDFPKSDQPLRVKRSTTIQELYNIVEKLVGLPPQQFRLWKFTSFSDSPSTPSVYLNKAKRSMTLSQHSQYEMKLFVENVMLTSVQDNELLDKILIFFKFYEPLHSQLSIIGYDYISSHSTLLDIIPLFIKMTGLDPQTRFTIFKEECKLARECVTTVTIGRNLRHGDILIFQENIPNNCEFPTAEHYCARLAKHVDVTFKFAGEYCVQQYFKDNKELSTAVKDSYEFSEPFTLNLLADMNYDQVAELVAEHIKFQHPERIRFLSENPITGKPDHAFKRKKLRHETLKTVSDFMSKCRSSRMLSIFFELLDISVSELEAKVLLLINFNGRNHKLLMDPSETVEEATARLLSATGQSEKSPDAYRLLEIKHFQIAHVCDTLTTCGELPLGTDFRLEEIPEDQQELDDERETLVPVCHFHQKPDNLHGQPYLVRLVKGEPLDKTRDRIRKAGGFSEANFSKWRLCVVADGHSKYLDDDSASDVCLYTLVVQSDADFVGLDRPGRSVRLSRPEIPLVIHQ